MPQCDELFIHTELADHHLHFARLLTEGIGDGSLALYVLLLHVIFMTQAGHIRISLPELADQAQRNWFVFSDDTFLHIPMYTQILHTLLTDFIPVIHRNPNVFGEPGVYKPVINLDNRYLYLQKQHEMESRFLKAITRHLVQDHSPASQPDAILSLLNAQGGSFQLNPAQQQAVRLALSHSLAIISGGPGTGKTTTIVSIIRALLLASAQPLNIVLAAPTGRAANRIMESITASLTSQNLDPALRSRFPQSAHTLHKLLGISRFTQGLPTYHAGNPIPLDVLIVDEASMIDLKLMTWTLEALPPDCQLILVGDKDQLPSVDTGALLTDMIAGEQHQLRGRVVQLQGSQRSNPAIINLAAAVNTGHPDSFLAQLAAPSVQIRYYSSAPEAVRFISRQYPVAQIQQQASFSVLFQPLVLQESESVQRILEVMAYFERFAVLCPTRHGPMGVSAINETCCRQAGGAMFFAGQPIMITRNDYDLELFNGDRGVLIGWADGLRAVFRTSHGLVSYALSQLKSFSTAYAQTIHKSQGSEFDEVLILMPESIQRMVSREILYTAITRARHTVHLSGSFDTFRQAITTKITRFSGIRDFLCNF